ncbi:MAG: prepilin peptidase, partial [Planctomycetales bacterium]|nr:prepilin peptidase [Planctomycetales bacterium]
MFVPSSCLAVVDAQWLTAGIIVLVGLWMVALGGCVGSFLNVVAYRLPRRMALSYPPSRCPVCGHSIRARDNVPVLGWLWLRGKCRDCGTTISARYPAVEAITAMSFLLVGIADILGRPRAALDSIPGSSLLTTWSTYLVHITIIATIITLALLERDKLRVPRSLLLVSLSLVALWQCGVHVGKAPYGMPHWSHVVSGLQETGIGATWGALLGIVLGFQWPGTDGGSHRRVRCFVAFVVAGAGIGPAPMGALAAGQVVSYGLWCWWRSRHSSWIRPVPKWAPWMIANVLLFFLCFRCKASG